MNYYVMLAFGKGVDRADTFSVFGFINENEALDFISKRYDMEGKYWISAELIKLGATYEIPRK